MVAAVVIGLLFLLVTGGKQSPLFVLGLSLKFKTTVATLVPK